MLRRGLHLLTILTVHALRLSVHAQADNTPLVPFSLQGQPLDCTATGISTSRENPILLFKPSPPNATRTVESTATRYLQVTYSDRGYGRLDITFKSSDGAWSKPDKLIHPVLEDSGKMVTAYARCADLALNAPEIRIGLGKLDGSGSLSIQKVRLQTQPFADSHFQYELSEDWRHPYIGPSATAIDNSTLVGKIMVGYQGWFRTPNDPYDAGWVHWGDIPKQEFAIDMWPDLTEYPADVLDKAAAVKTRSGKTAYLFSPAWPETVRVHFAMMRRHNIDGVFLQRFLAHPTSIFPLGGGPEWVLGNVREAANREGRIWAVEYDISGVPDDQLLEYISKDWRWLVDSFGIRQDHSYAHQNGKPVVFVWGMSLPSRHISLATANAVVDFLKTDPKYGGNYVIGGISGNWRALDPSWQDHFSRQDCVLSWHSQDYSGDAAACRNLGVGYYPIVWPGFSWSNLKRLPTVSNEGGTPRGGGKFYEDLFAKAIDAGAQRIFVGMFDEYNEGTAIMPMSDDPPPTPQQGGTNLKFFANPVFEGSPPTLAVPRVDLVLDGTPPQKGMPTADYSLRYDGEIDPPATGTYEFAINGIPGDLLHLVVGVKKLDVAQFTTTLSPKLSVELTAGRRVSYKIEYRHGLEAGHVQLLWQKPGTNALELVPDAAMVGDYGRFVTNEGQPPDHWLALTGKWKQRLVDRVTPSAPSH